VKNGGGAIAPLPLTGSGIDEASFPGRVRVAFGGQRRRLLRPHASSLL